MLFLNEGYELLQKSTKMNLLHCMYNAHVFHKRQIGITNLVNISKEDRNMSRHRISRTDVDLDLRLILLFVAIVKLCCNLI